MSRPIVPVRPSARMRGFSMVELMISIVIGLIVAGAAVALFATSSITYKATEGIGRIQEANRTAYMLMARDMRDAGGNPCDNTSTNYSLTTGLNAPSAHWWSDWNNGMVGYTGTTAFPDAAFGTSAGQRVSGTDAIELKAGDVKAYVTANSTDPTASIAVNSVAYLTAGDLMILCDYYSGVIFQGSSFSGNSIAHVVAGTPGNTSTSLPKVQATEPLDPVTGAPPPLWNINGTVSRFRPTRWYIGCNGRYACDQPGGRSLFQSSLVNTGGVLSVVNNEIASGASNMSLTYLVTGATAYVDAGSVADWSKVIAVKLSLTFTAIEKVGTDNNAITRTFLNVVTLRNRLS